MAENTTREGIFDRYANLGKRYFNLERMRKFAAWYIDTNEKLANRMLDLQAAATGWAKKTRLAKIVEAQDELSRKFVKRSAEAARTIFQLDQS